MYVDSIEKEIKKNSLYLKHNFVRKSVRVLVYCLTNEKVLYSLQSFTSYIFAFYTTVDISYIYYSHHCKFNGSFAFFNLLF